MKRRWLIISCLTSLALHGATPFDGLCGKELFMAVRASYGNPNPPETSEIWSILSRVDKTDDGTINNIFSDETLTIPSDGISPAEGALFRVIHPSYWNMPVPPEDIVNIFPATVSEVENQHDYPPVFCSSERSQLTLKYDNGFWGSGIYSLAPGYDINCYLPPKGYEGDFARVVMHMITAYACNDWYGKGNNIFLDDFPIFQSYYLRDLLQCAASDPVDDREKRRNTRLTEICGCGNPFVEYPALADHIWGNAADKPFQSSSPETVIPIKPTYGQDDKFFHCQSPFLPGEVEWFILNNVRYRAGEAAPLEGMVPGRYTVSYGGKNFSGSVVIELVR
ncbi:MAG: endonuclease [Muribaculaceae bacterium]|nr:endonuclease [Muribaculaceae bacterium]